MYTCCCHIDLPQQSLLDKILPSLVSGCIIVLLFVVGRLLDRAIKSKETRRNWYQKVVIDPNISRLNKFYADLIIQLRESTDSLTASQVANMPYKNYLDEKAKEGAKFKEIKRSFEYEFVYLVQANFSEIGDSLSSHLLELEDILMTHIDKPNYSSDDFLVCERKIALHKSQIYRILYEPIKFKRPSLRRLVKSFFQKA